MIADLPESYAAGESSAETAISERWWKAFRDERLDGLIAEAFEGSWDLDIARSRLAQAVALGKQRGADRWPDLSLDASARRAKTVITTTEGTSASLTSDQFALGLAASYELDLWGRVASVSKAAKYDVDASRADFETAALSLAAGIANTWFEVNARHAQVELLKSQIKASRDYVDLTEFRFGQGQASALDVFQQRQQTAGLEALLPQAEAVLLTQQNQLAVLLGRTPYERVESIEGHLPVMPPLPALGVPGDLITRRPDVRAALIRIEAADERTAAAVANRLPAIRITGAAGYQAEDVGDLFDDWIWNVVGSVVTPIIDWGGRRAEAERNRAVVREQISSAAKAIANALREVEDALIREQKQQETLERQRAQLELAGETLRQSRKRYVNGLVDYLTVLTALERKQALERELVAGELSLLSYRVALYRALGGEWMSEL